MSLTRLFLLASLLLLGTTATQRSLSPMVDQPTKDPSFPSDDILLQMGHSQIGQNEGMSLADVLTVERRASLWWDYARDVMSVNARLINMGQGKESTLLVPLDSAIMRLPMKPHQSNNPDLSFQTNIERFLSAHLIPGRISLPSSRLPTLLPGIEVEVVQGTEGWMVVPGNITVVDVREAANGMVLLMDGVVDYSSA
ncbi:hypothetical protein M231_03687 [Tremella mesenterica]|uniref:FAS1 domain-containing protein n=1 Tax=Tremella mesenterica TaxID=5217 RepID=A0A4Q1BML2_TREME|nr:hypothetical protein M231_03687 [Tremella mesenterica]